MFKKLLIHIFWCIRSYFWALCFYLSYLLSRLGRDKTDDTSAWEEDEKPEITVVMTTCARPEFLMRTLDTFKTYNTYPIKKFIVIEDGGCPETEHILKDMLSEYDVSYIFNSINLGQLKSIDTAYAQVTTELVFHLEEDWEFIRPGFIEHSLNHLRRYRKCITLSLRRFDDQQNHPVKREHLEDDFLLYKPFWRGCWVGYGFNPSLRRMSDYQSLIGGYSGFGNRREISIGLFYYWIGLKVHVLDYGEEGYAKHPGANYSTGVEFGKA